MTHTLTPRLRIRRAANSVARATKIDTLQPYSEAAAPTYNQQEHTPTPRPCIRRAANSITRATEADTQQPSPEPLLRHPHRPRDHVPAESMVLPPKRQKATPDAEEISRAAAPTSRPAPRPRRHLADDKNSKATRADKGPDLQRHRPKEESTERVDARCGQGQS